MRFALALLPLLALAACGGGTENASTPVTSSTPVAQAAPPAGKQWVDIVSKTPEGGFRQGNPNAPIQLVEYGSRTCPTCGRFAAEGVEPLRQKYVSTGKVSYEFRDFPLHGAPDLALALLNQCVGTEAFFPMLDQMFANQANFGEKMTALPETFMAQPPGKKLQSLTLLSGGEQALTAVALIFALFLTNPAPICVLDEVDAPLDDANIERFCDLLEAMTRETATRYLIVTHNAATMSRMHRLFGVTMVERGVSRLVSVDLGGAETLLAAE